MSRANPRFRRINPPLPVPSGNLYRVFTEGAIENQQTVNVFHYQDNQTPGSSINPTLLYNTFILPVVGVWSSYIACLSADWTSVRIKVDSPNNPSLSPVVVNVVNSGTGPAGHAPTETSGIMLRKTAVRSQSGRGRIGLPAVPLSWITNSMITVAAGMTAYNTLATQMAAVLPAGSVQFTPGVISKPPKTKILGFAPLTSVIPNFLLGTIRRRRIGRGK